MLHQVTFLSEAGRTPAYRTLVGFFLGVHSQVSEELAQVGEGFVAVAVLRVEQAGAQVIKLFIFNEVPDSNEICFFEIRNSIWATLLFFGKLSTHRLLALYHTPAVIESPYSDSPLLLKYVDDVVSVVGNALLREVELPDEQLALEGILVRVIVGSRIIALYRCLSEHLGSQH